MEYIYIDGKKVKAEKIESKPPKNEGEAQDHILDEMQVGPIKRFFYKKVLQFLDDFIERP